MWFKNFSVQEINNRPKNHLGGLLGIEFIEITDTGLSARMPVDDRTKQPYGILHGGASVVLAETVGSIASSLIIDPEQYIAVGLEVNANHLRPVKQGFVTAHCTAIHLGAKTHVWDIKIYTDAGKLSCISRLTVAIVPNNL